MADAADSKSAAGHPAWGFNSPLQHQRRIRWRLQVLPSTSPQDSGLGGHPEQSLDSLQDSWIPRSARNDNPKEALTQTPKPRPSAYRVKTQRRGEKSGPTLRRQSVHRERELNRVTEIGGRGHGRSDIHGVGPGGRATIVGQRCRSASSASAPQQRRQQAYAQQPCGATLPRSSKRRDAGQPQQSEEPEHSPQPCHARRHKSALRRRE